MAAHQKKGSRLRAHLVFIDESGFMMAPLVRRTWARRGATPILYQRGRRHEKISVIAALCITPQRDRLHLYFRLHPDANINSDRVIAFLRGLLRQLRTHVLVVWDRLLAHRSCKVNHFIQEQPLLHTYFLPPYAPELNPVEGAWSYLKMNPMANFAPTVLRGLVMKTRTHARSLQRKETLLRSFLKRTPLSLRLR